MRQAEFSTKCRVFHGIAWLCVCFVE